ncbi:MAG TPA: prepilin peptidase [Polyangia bacterium]|jgi:leader peptidase (prepilin peptidase)/N-methyltransferase|nr:prepilin peptidase [Polyangia bacterium]
MDGAAEFLLSPVAIALAGLLGAVWGSFFNVCIARVPLGQSVVRPASRCMSCGTAVRPVDNIPIVSYLLLRGRCRSCGTGFSPRYALVEALMGGLSALLFWKAVTLDVDGAVAIRLARFALYFAFCGTLVVLSFIDLDTKLLPDVITLPAIPIFFLAAFGAHEVGWRDRAIGALAGYLFVRLIADAYFYILKREGMGLGDGKLLAMMGAALGWKALPFIIFGGSFLGAAISIPLLLVARRRQKTAPGGTQADADDSLARMQVPFGPFLSLAAILYLFVGQSVLHALVAPLDG